MKGRFLLVLSLILIFVMSFSGFGKVKIKYWLWLDRPQDPLFYDMVKEFNATHPDIEVEYEVIPWDSYHSKLLNALVSGNPPDCARIHVTWLGELDAMKVLEPLDKYLKNWSGYSNVFENIWPLLKAKPDGPVYVVPFQMVVLYLYYRKDLFEKYGLKVPSDYKEFLEVAKKLTLDLDGDGRIDLYGYGLRGARGGHAMWNTFVGYFDREGKIRTGKSIIDANQWYADLFAKYKVTPPTAPTDGFLQVLGGFKSGKTAMIIHHIGSSNDVVKALGKDKVGVARVPIGINGGWTHVVPEGNAIFSSSKHKKEAFEFISWMAEHDQVDRWCRMAGSVPVLKSVAKLPYYKENIFQKVSIESVEIGGTLPTVPQTAEFVETLWPTLFQKVMLGQMTSEEMIKKLNELFGVE